MDRGDLANLSAFVTVADQRSFRAAASRLDVTPSALSPFDPAAGGASRGAVTEPNHAQRFGD